MYYAPLDFTKLKRYSALSRPSRVSVAAEAIPHRAGGRFSDFLDGLPDALAARDIRSVSESIAGAHRRKRPVILGMGAHPLKVGLAPIIINLMQRGIISALACNGACIVHDFEIAFMGRTSEDVAGELADGSFGMAEETGSMLNEAVNSGVRKGYGIGRAVGEYIDFSDFPFKAKSVFREARRLEVPTSVHVAIGTDILHMHPEADGALIGEGSLRDFKLFSSVVAELEGGVYVNLGSAVLLPEVFLKAISVVRNLGHRVEEFSTVNMDFIQHYRPAVNVLRRPTAKKGRSFALTGHHEIMFPLLAAMVIEALDGGHAD
ncbi:MAG: hypothetical protein ACM3ON_05805 [Chloroflexota bacterium]